MPKKRFTSQVSAPTISAQKPNPIVFDGKDRNYKDVIRFLILQDLLDRSHNLPTRIFSLLGRECSDLLLWIENGLNFESCVSVENNKNELKIQKKTISSKLKKFRHKIQTNLCDVRAYFSENKKSKKDKELFEKGFDLLFLDYIGCYNQNMIKDLRILCSNQEMLHNTLKERGSLYLYTTTSNRYQNSDDRQYLHDLESNYSHLSPEIDESSETAKEGRPLYIDHLDAYGTHYSVSEIFSKIGIRCQQIHCVYYRDGNKGTRMLLSGWKLTKIDTKGCSESNHQDQELQPPLTPVYLGLRNRKNHPQSIQWIKNMKASGIITFRDDEFNQIDRSHKNLKKTNPSMHKKVDAILRRLVPIDPALLEITQNNTRGIITKPMDKECKLALLEAGKISKPKSNTKQDWAKISVAITNCLKSHRGPVSQSTLTKAVLTCFPEYKILQTARAGNLNQSKLTNAMAWAKSALKQGGYTISKKDCLAGEILKLTSKGRTANLNRAAKHSWEEHFNLIKKGKL